MKEKHESKVLTDRKKFSGTGRCTNKVMNTLQNYHGMVVRSNTGNLFAMKKGIAAILFHCSENIDDEKRHKYCPRTPDTWCKYQREKHTGEPTYDSKINIPLAVRDVITPIFSHEDLASDAPLTRADTKCQRILQPMYLEKGSKRHLCVQKETANWCGISHNSFR